MSQEQLHRDLERLDREIAEARPGDEKSTALLRKLREDIRAALAQGDAASSAQYQSIGDSLRDSVYHFDASHPQLAKTMASVIDSLALLNL
ncbi:MAG: DUF4404 family protein [Gemmatimonadota bacterium]